MTSLDETLSSSAAGSGPPRTVWIRRFRMGQGALAIAVLVAAGLAAGLDPLGDWWFWIAATTVLTIAVVEPYYTGTTSALLFSLGALGAGLTADRAGVEALWTAYFVFAALVLAMAIVALVTGATAIGEAARWFATRFGRPLWLGLFAVSIELIRRAAAGSVTEAGYLALGSAVAVSIATPDWYRLAIAARPSLDRIATVETALEPNLVLVTTSQRLHPGAAVTVRGTASSNGVVIGNLAHKDGNRVQIALDRPWFEVVQGGGQPCSVHPRETSGEDAVAFVAEGSTDRSLCLRPLGGVVRGDALYWEESGQRRHLYQVVERELVRELWDGAAVVSERAAAVPLGTVEAGILVLGNAFPTPYSALYSAKQLSGVLPAGHERIGRIAGTRIPFGVSPESLRGHHMAILGMSGMGKSTIARRLMDMAALRSTVVAMDGTGEYRSRFGVVPWDPSVGLGTDGAWVYEPVGVQAERAADFIRQVMDTANGEYAVGAPRSRTLLIEEAHTFLPEWNFVAARGESDHVARSCRYILQARKFGISFILVSQRTAVISKSALSQCESYVVLRTLDETSLQYIEGVLGREFRATVAALGRYQAVCVGPAFSTQSPVVVDLDPYVTGNAPHPTSP